MSKINLSACNLCQSAFTDWALNWCPPANSIDHHYRDAISDENCINSYKAVAYLPTGNMKPEYKVCKECDLKVPNYQEGWECVNGQCVQTPSGTQPYSTATTLKGAPPGGWPIGCIETCTSTPPCYPVTCPSPSIPGAPVCSPVSCPATPFQGWNYLNGECQLVPNGMFHTAQECVANSPLISKWKCLPATGTDTSGTPACITSPDGTYDNYSQCHDVCKKQGPSSSSSDSNLPIWALIIIIAAVVIFLLLIVLFLKRSKQPLSEGIEPTSSYQT